MCSLKFEPIERDYSFKNLMNAGKLKEAMEEGEGEEAWKIPGYTVIVAKHS